MSRFTKFVTATIASFLLVGTGMAPANATTVTLDPAVCSATITNTPSSPAGSPIVRNDLGGDFIGASTGKVLNSDEGVTDLLPLPFTLDSTNTETWSARAEANGAVSFDIATDRESWSWNRNNTFNMLLADFDSSAAGGVYLDTCVFNLDGQQYDGVSATFAGVPYFRDAATITAQLILLKTSDAGYTVIRNYQNLELPGNLGVIPFNGFYDSVLEKQYTLESSNPVDGPDISTDLMAGSGGTFDTTLRAEILDGGSSALNANFSLGTTQPGRYLKTFTTGMQTATKGSCDPGVTRNFKVTYSAPRVYAVDPTFTNIITEDFDAFVPGGQIYAPTTTAIGDFEGAISVYAASPIIGAGGVGNGIQIPEYNPATFTPHGNTCNRYLGFWWSAGNATNYVELLDGRGTVLARFTAADLYADLNGKSDYFGNPLDQTQVPNEVFAYVNIRYPAGFSKFRFSGTGFELDNISMSVDNQTVGSDEVVLTNTVITDPTPTPNPTRPVVSNLTFQQNAGHPTFNKPAYTTDGTVADSGWFLCDSEHNGPDSYDLPSSAPADCVFTDNRDAVFTAPNSAIGKYVAYWVFAQNATGNTFAIQTSPLKFGDVKIVDLTSTSPFAVSNYSVIGNSNKTATWYRCDSASSSATALPPGTCTSTGVSTSTYTPTLADLGKYLVFQVHAQAIDSVSTDNQVVGSAQAVTFADLTGQYISTFTVSLTGNKSSGFTSAITIDPAATADVGQWFICNQQVNLYSAATFTGDRAIYRQSKFADLQTSQSCTAIANQTNPAAVPISADYQGKYLTFTSTSYYSNVYMLRSKSTIVNLSASGGNTQLTKTFTGFKFERAKLSTETKQAISAWIQSLTGLKTVSCTGYTGFNWYHRPPASLKHLANNRATNVCSYIKRLNPTIRITSIQIVNETSKRAATRRVVVTFKK